MTGQLNTKMIYPPVPSPMPVTFVKPLSYEFRVAEYLDDKGKITKVALQWQIWEHGEDGFGSLLQTWMDVPRVQFDSNGSMIPSF